VLKIAPTLPPRREWDSPGPTKLQAILLASIGACRVVRFSIGVLGTLLKCVIDFGLSL
jgi:hypothetical protein